MDKLRVEVLGPVRAWRGPAELALGPARQRAVFAVLALRAGRPVTRDELVSAVWGADAPKSVAGNIHTYVSGLRRALDADRALLTSDAAGYRLDVPTVDAIEFERLLRDTDALDTALAMWHGDPLSGMPGPFAEQERTRLAGLRLDALERRASVLLDAGADEELRAELTALVKEYPLREPFRELLMLALHRGGQRAEALEVYAEGHRILAAELGVEPGSALRDLHARLLGDEPDAPDEPDRLIVRPPPAGEPFVGRHAVLRRLRTLVDVLREGRGGAMWIEGDFGIGKSALLAHALATVPESGCQLGWAVADERSAEVPLGVVQDCLRTAADSADALLTLVTERCRHAPLMLVVDGMQWADEASAQLWHRLTVLARQLPLLLVAAARPVPRGPALSRLRHELHSRDAVLVLDPLSADESLELRDRLAGSPAGPQARELVLGMAGNPRYVTELATAANPASLIDTARGQLEVLSDEARETLRAAALLGVEFTVTGVAAVAGKRPSELLAMLEEATAGNIVADAGDHLAFRHPLLREACYAEIRGRGPRHRAAAEALAGAGAPVTQVADQLADAGLDAWGLAWLVDHHTALANRAPLVAAELLDRAISLCLRDDPRREVLAAARVRVLYRLDRHPEREAAEALAMATDPDRAAEMRQLLATLRFRRGDVAAAIRTVTDAGADGAVVPEIWRQRHRHLLAGFQRGRLDDDLDAAESAGRVALDEAAGDAYLTAHARQTLWLVATVRRDHEAALAHVDAALDSVQGGTDLELDLLDNRLFTCHNLDRLDEAAATLRAARRRPFHLSAAVHHYWTGRWNEALVELDAVEGPGFGLRDPTATALLRHGVAALIAGRRGDGIQAAAHLDAVARHGSTSEERENVDFLLMAEALIAEQYEEPDLSIVDPLLDPGFAPMMLRHQWLPEVVRLALAAGDDERVSRAMRVCGEEAEKELVTARATVASWWCRGLVEEDPSLVLAAVEHYRHVGRVVERGSALEDAAVLLARAGALDAARKAFDECTGVYAELSARWDLDRADARLSEFGITVTRLLS